MVKEYVEHRDGGYFLKGARVSLDSVVESGRFQRFRTMIGSFAAYEHEVTI